MIGVKNVTTCFRRNLISEKFGESKPVTEMVERFVQSLANANDSGSFDTSLEVKSIHPQRKRSKCLTELDRESLVKFVKEFEERNKVDLSGRQIEELSPKRVKCAKMGENVSEKQKIYENNLILGSPTLTQLQMDRKRYSLSPLSVNKFSSSGQVSIASIPEASSTDSDFESSDQDFIENDEKEEEKKSASKSDIDTIYEKTPENRIDLTTRKIETERRACKSVRVLKFFSSARKKVKSCNPSSCNSSPIPHRSTIVDRMECKRMQNSDTEDDDGIFTGPQGSRNISPDSSFEMQPPIIPTFLVTPPSTLGNPAYELAKILRGSFHSKRASVSTLRRSISDPDHYQLDYILQQDGDSHGEFFEAKSVVKKGLGAAMIKNLDVICSRALPTSASPFRRWGQSSFRTPKTIDSRCHLTRRPSSLAASESDVYTKSMDDFNVDFNFKLSQSDLSGEPTVQQTDDRAGVAAWGSSFEKLLEDTTGIHTFAEFLKIEFSAENIYFWTACERYRRTESCSDRATQAMEIFSKHLANGAPEPVNVDSQARNTAEDNLQTADRILFNQAQKQIFNLMKFDSYQRFIRSDLYKKCIEAEAKNQPLPYPGDKLDALLRTTPENQGHSKLKKSTSNAEDRHRKSLLPWHRKTRCKSKDRAEADINSNKSAIKLQSGGISLKASTANSASDIHSSRSSLSSFDATVAAAIGNGPDDAKSISLCRVILCDGATTIVQTRPKETVRQLVERLLEKRGIHYQFFDVIIGGSSKAIDLESPAIMLAGREVQIEQRVAFKLDLPDPKVISVKSKPKKTLCDVLRPILHKYNYRLEEVQVLHRETHERLDMTLPVTVADGQRLQVVLMKNEGCRSDAVQNYKHRSNSNYMHSYQNHTCMQLPKNPSFPSKGIKPVIQQSTLDEITNKVFNELLQGKVESHANQSLSVKPSDQCSLQSEDCASESSSIFERLRRKDSNIPALKAFRPKKIDQPSKCSIAPSDDGVSSSTQNTSVSDPTSNGIKKPLIAKWKTGARIQVTGLTENHEEFLEGLKRAQRARLEDQRGTEINSELPDFLKNKENLSVASKLRKVRANLSPIGGVINSSDSNINDEGLSNSRNPFEIPNPVMERPQPAPRLSITKSGTNVTIISPGKGDINASETLTDKNTQCTLNEFESDFSCKGPPPLPPKPKILPIKPSNWGQTTIPNSLAPSKIPVDITRRHLGSSEENGRNVYLDQPSSSFV